MTINEISELQEKCLKDPDDDNLAHDYSNAVADYLKSNKIGDEILRIIVKGVEIDKASNLFDYFETISKKDIKDVWKLLNRNDLFKGNYKNNSIKLLAGMIYMALLNNEAIISIAPGIFSEINAVIASKENPVASNVYKSILANYCFAELPVKNTALPEWKLLKVTPTAVQTFVDYALETVTDDEGLKSKLYIKNWLNSGKKYAADEIKREKIEFKIPKSKLADIQAILAHYTEVEKQLRDSVYREEKLVQDIEKLNEQIATLMQQNADLARQIKELNGNAKQQQKVLAEAEKEIEERKAINDAFDALKKNDEGAILKDIANDLKAEYRDFKDSEADDMDTQLGEIYREKLHNIFRILENKGIKVE